MTYEGFSVIGLSHNGEVLQEDVTEERDARELAWRWLNACSLVEVYGREDEVVWSSR